MKNAKLKRLSNLQKKQIRNQIRLRMVMKLSELAGQYHDSAKFKRLIGKSAKKLSKKISKKLNIDTLNIPEVVSQSNENSVQQMSDEMALNRTKSNIQRAHKTAVLVKKEDEAPVGIS